MKSNLVCPTPGCALFLQPGVPKRLRPSNYGPTYRDEQGRRPGDRGFVPPITGVVDEAEVRRKLAGLAEGYDSDYRDHNGLQPGDPGFVPPCYTSDYTDAAGQQPGDEGFVPPARPC